MTARNTETIQLRRERNDIVPSKPAGRLTDPQMKLEQTSMTGKCNSTFKYKFKKLHNYTITEDSSTKIKMNLHKLVLHIHTSRKQTK